MLVGGDYELIDFGEGRKLERFGPWVVDRPAPGVGHVAKHQPMTWKNATARYVGDRTDAGTWKPGPKSWRPDRVTLEARVADRVLSLQLEPLPSGQIGVFPEHADGWSWIAKQTKSAGREVHVLNLFAYTGGGTLAAAAAGAHVTHVDAAKSIVARARENATLSGLADRPIRWIVEDALKFCQREVKRGRRYDAIVLDPPSFGRGPHAETWTIHRDLLPLLQVCRQLVANQLAFALVSCHTPSIGPADLSAYVAEGLFGSCSQPGDVQSLDLLTEGGRRMASGIAVRWPP